MGKEFEIKIPVSKDKLVEMLYKYGCDSDIRTEFELKFKKDSYYSRYKDLDEGKANGEFLTRIRAERSSHRRRINSKLIETFLDESKELAQVEPVTYFLTLKQKNVKAGIEDNYENELIYVDNQISQMKTLFENMGLKVVFEKVKETLSFTDMRTGCNVDISRMKGNYWVEIEYVSEKADNPMLRVEEMCSILGLDIINRDTRSWPEIIKSLNNG